MFRHISRFALVGSFLIVLLARAPAQEDKPPEKPRLPAAEEEYRRFFRKPETTIEYWAAINYELRVGKLDFAGELLKELVEKKPAEEDLLQIEREQGMSTFLRMRTIPWSKDPKINKEYVGVAEQLIEQVTTALKNQLKDEARINRFIKNLNATPEERVYAIRELRRSGALAVPHIVEALRANQDPRVRNSIVTAIPQLFRDTVPALRAALYVDDDTVKQLLMDALMRRSDPLQMVLHPETDPVPYLWYLSSSPKFSGTVQKKARDAIAYFLQLDPGQLPTAKVALTSEAERYYQHKVKFADPREVVIWRWDDQQKKLVQNTATVSKAEEYYGLLFARQALDLDLTHRPAQVVFLSLAVEKASEQAGLDQPLGKTAPLLREILAAVRTELLLDILERAMLDKRGSVILALARVLGDLGEVQALRPTSNGLPPLVRALYYPDHRIQMAAADSILRIPGTPPPAASVRIVDILRRSLAGDPVPKILIVDANQDRATAVNGAVRKAGFETVVAHTGKEAFARLKSAADIEVVLVDAGVVDPLLRDWLAQARADIDVGLVPVIVTLAPDANGTVPPELEVRVRRLAEPYRNVTVMPTSTDSAELAGLLLPQVAGQLGLQLSEEQLKDPIKAAPDLLKRVIAEHQNEAAESLVWLRRMIVGEVAGYDAHPATDVFIASLRSDERAPLAIEAVGQIPGKTAQQSLATLVLDGQRRPELRIAAAEKLVRHIQRNGVALTTQQIQALGPALQGTDDANLKARIVLLLGVLKARGHLKEGRLQDYLPAPAPPPVPPAKEEKP